MSLFKDHECVGSFRTTESALAEIGRLLVAQTSRAPHDPPDPRDLHEMLLIGVGAPAKTIHLFRAVAPPIQTGAPLTPHERRVLGLLVEGHNYKTAAAALGVSVNTVSFHVRRVYEKLQVHSKSEAVVKALKNNLV